MDYFVICSFDLKAGSLEEHQDALAELVTLGFSRWTTVAEFGSLPLPANVCIGTFEKSSPDALRDELLNSITKAFSRRSIDADIFLCVGSSCLWGFHRFTAGFRPVRPPLD